jgi:hypothetical protein
MIFKLVTGVIDSTWWGLLCNFTGSQFGTRENRYKLTQKHVHYNRTRLSQFEVVCQLPDDVVSACSRSTVATNACSVTRSLKLSNVEPGKYLDG